jgi:surface polysaccharide O-acyltransferase-like enzyme
MSATKTARVVGIDYLRAVFSVCVVAVHLGYISPSTIFDPDEYTSHTFTWSDFLNFYVLCLAVPVFVVISTYLYALKPADGRGLARRLGRILRLLVFWSVAYQIFFFTGYGFPKQIPHDAVGIVLYLMSGGNTVYYFFVSLALVTIVTHYSRNLPTAAVWSLFAVSTALVGVMPLLHEALCHKTPWAILLGHLANPLNFLPLAFAGLGLARLTQAQSTRTLDLVGWTALAIGAACAVLDWTVYVDPCFFEVNRFALPAYTRPSLVFLAVAVLVLAIRARPPENPVVAFMAYHSLAVYCLHPFFVPVRYKMAQVLHLTGAVEVLAALPVVLALSYGASMVLPRFLRDEVLR